MTDSRPDRESMRYDVVIVGGGPAGLATAIRLKQQRPDTSVALVEKGAEIGAHILSGAVIDPSGLDALLPDWRGAGLLVPVTEDAFYLLTARSGFRLSGFLMPKLMANHGNFTGSLGKLCRWLAERATELGVEIYPGFAASEPLFDGDGRLIGIATGDVGVNRDGTRGPDFQPGVALLARYTVLAEGARGSVAKQVIARFGLADGRSPQKYGLGLKELWRVAPENHRPGRIEHSFGWPLGGGAGASGGSFLYHLADNQVAIGYVVHLDYRNPYLSPFEEFQRFKTHPMVRRTLAGGERLAYGARAISEGGWQSVPRLSFAGGVLVGDAAGFVNLPRIKGSHNAVSSGMLAAASIAAALDDPAAPAEPAGYDDAWRQSAIGRDLFPVRNVKPLWSRLGLVGVALGGFDMWCQQLFGLSPFGTLRHRKADHESLDPAAAHRPIAYPKPDGVLTFDRLASVYVSNTNHAENQPPHLIVRDPALQAQSEYGIYAGPSQFYCPAGVYEWRGQGGDMTLTINAQNCVHCKSCDIKDPNQNIDWVPPEGGGGPNYAGM